MPAIDIIRDGSVRLIRALAGPGLVPDIVAGLTLAAIAVPEQMATARLGHFSPDSGFVAFIAGTLGFVALGVSRTVSVGADSTITPIFAASLALMAMPGSPVYGVLASVLAIMVGTIVAVAGLCRMGWISNLLSRPVTVGFLAGISIHIVASQLPVLCGLPAGSGEAIARLAFIGERLSTANPDSVLVGLGVLALTAAAARMDRKWPGALVAVTIATAATIVFGLHHRGVEVLGVVAPPVLHLPAAMPQIAQILKLAPLALLLAMVVMVQSAATSRSFPSDPDSPPNIDRDYVGVGFANLVSGLAGSFPVNASPPRTAISAEAGARSKRTGLIATVAIALLAILGSGLLANVPGTALAGVLLFVALRILQVRVALAVWRESKAEFALILATALAIVVLPIETGVAVGILLSLLHGMWTTTRARVIELVRVPGASIWWPPADEPHGEESVGVMVLAFQAPLSFLNAEIFRRGILDHLARAPAPIHLVVLEASSIVEIDFTAAHALTDVIVLCRKRGARFAIARLESVRAQASIRRFGIADLVGTANIYRSVYEAVEAWRT